MSQVPDAGTLSFRMMSPSPLISSFPLQRDARAAEGRPVEELITVDPATGLKLLPHWVAQPYFRAQPKVAEPVDKKSDKEETVVAEDGTPARPPLGEYKPRRCLDSGVPLILGGYHT